MSVVSPVKLANLTVENLSVSDSGSSAKPWPSVTTSERDALVDPEAGSVVFNTTTNQLNVYVLGAWTTLGGGGGDYTALQTITGNYTASSLDDLLVDASAAALTITLPASPTVGAKVRLRDMYFDDGSTNLAKSWAVKNVTVDRNGENIDGAASNMTADVAGAMLELIYTGSALGWRSY